MQGGARPALPEAIALPVHLQDVNTVGEPVQQGSGQPLRAKDLRSLVEGQVGGHQDGPSLVALAEDLEEELSPVLESGTLAHRVPVQPEHPRGLPGAHPLHHAGPAYLCVQLHPVHPSAPSIVLAVTRWKAAGGPVFKRPCSALAPAGTVHYHSAVHKATGG